VELSGADGFLAKPDYRERVFAVIRNLISAGKSRSRSIRTRRKERGRGSGKLLPINRFVGFQD